MEAPVMKPETTAWDRKLVTCRVGRCAWGREGGLAREGGREVAAPSRTPAPTPLHPAPHGPPPTHNTHTHTYTHPPTHPPPLTQPMRSRPMAVYSTPARKATCTAARLYWSWAAGSAGGGDAGGGGRRRACVGWVEGSWGAAASLPLCPAPRTPNLPACAQGMHLRARTRGVVGVFVDEREDGVQAIGQQHRGHRHRAHCQLAGGAQQRVCVVVRAAAEAAGLGGSSSSRSSRVRGQQQQQQQG